MTTNSPTTTDFIIQLVHNITMYRSFDFFPPLQLFLSTVNDLSGINL